MHLSLLSDSYLSDRLSDAGLYSEEDVPTAGQAHRDGLLRGLAMMGVFAVLIGLGCATSIMPCAQADAVAHHTTRHLDHAAQSIVTPAITSAN